MAAAAARDAGLVQEDPQLKRSVMKRLDTYLHLGSDRIGNVSVSDAADDGYAYDRMTGVVRCVWCGAAITDPRNVDLSVIRQLHNVRCPRGPPLLDEPQPTQPPPLSEDEVEGPYTEVDLSSQSLRSTVPLQTVRDDNERMREQRRCKRCNRSQVETLFLPCRHLVACEVCADEVEDCFVCDTKILGTVRIYLD